MRLSRQLGLVSLLMLALPWAGCQYVREMEQALRLGQQQALLATAQTVASALQASPALLPPSQHQEQINPLYAFTIDYPLILDGYDSEWVDIHPRAFSSGDFNAELRAAVNAHQLFILLDVSLPSSQFHDPTRGPDNGDRLLLTLGNGQQYLMAASAPGKMMARQLSDDQRRASYDPRIEGVWQTTYQGYRIEMQMPLALLNQTLSLQLFEGAAPARQLQLAGTQTSTSPLITELPQLSQQLALFTRAELKLQVLDQGGWIRAEHGHVNQAWVADEHWLLRELYRALIFDPTLAELPTTASGRLQRAEFTTALSNQPAAAWYQLPYSSNRRLLSIAVPLIDRSAVRAVLVAEQSSEPYLSLTDSAFARLASLTLLTLAIAGSGLLGYASWLSWRVRKLNRVAQQLIDDPRQTEIHFPGHSLNDELGELSRNYAKMVGRMTSYTDYLYSLSRKLSHELRTPLAIVQSSLDHLQLQPLDPAVARYQQRAKEGANRLGYILNALSEASQVEQSIAQAECEWVDVVKLLSDVVDAYDDLHHQHHIQFNWTGPVPTQPLAIAPELWVQMIDKLVDNAVDFADLGSTIELNAALSQGVLQLTVSNSGPQLPQQMAEQLFDNLVSVRNAQGERPHLGLGLHIVKLIAEFHQGRVWAYNRQTPPGVTFAVEIPAKFKD